MKTLTVGFSYPKKWMPFAWLIMTVYRTPFDHVYLKIDMPELDNKTLVFQASKTIVNLMDWEVFTGQNGVYREFSLPLADQDRSDFLNFIFATVGKPYSLLEVLGIAWIKICSWFGKKVDNPFKEGTTEYICSVLGAYVIENFVKEDVPGDFESVDPLTLYNFLLSKQNP